MSAGTKLANFNSVLARLGDGAEKGSIPDTPRHRPWDHSHQKTLQRHPPRGT
jgi:hypothetical protein